MRIMTSLVRLSCTTQPFFCFRQWMMPLCIVIDMYLILWCLKRDDQNLLDYETCASQGLYVKMISFVAYMYHPGISPFFQLYRYSLLFFVGYMYHPRIFPFFRYIGFAIWIFMLISLCFFCSTTVCWCCEPWNASNQIGVFVNPSLINAVWGLLLRLWLSERINISVSFGAFQCSYPQQTVVLYALIIVRLRNNSVVRECFFVFLFYFFYIPVPFKLLIPCLLSWLQQRWIVFIQTSNASNCWLQKQTFWTS